MEYVALLSRSHIYESCVEVSEQYLIPPEGDSSLKELRDNAVRKPSLSLMECSQIYIYLTNPQQKNLFWLLAVKLVTEKDLGSEPILRKKYLLFHLAMQKYSFWRDLLTPDWFAPATMTLSMISPVIGLGRTLPRWFSKVKPVILSSGCGKASQIQHLSKDYMIVRTMWAFAKKKASLLLTFSLGL